MAKRTAAKTLDRDGFIFVLAIGALAIILFVIYFFNANFRAVTKEILEPITSVSQLKELIKDVDGQNPDGFKVDLNRNATDAQNF